MSMRITNLDMHNMILYVQAVFGKVGGKPLATSIRLHRQGRQELDPYGDCYVRHLTVTQTFNAAPLNGCTRGSWALRFILNGNANGATFRTTSTMIPAPFYTRFRFS